MASGGRRSTQQMTPGGKAGISHSVGGNRDVKCPAVRGAALPNEVWCVRVTFERHLCRVPYANKAGLRTSVCILRLFHLLLLWRRISTYTSFVKFTVKE
jgi:hypothetical protein